MIIKLLYSILVLIICMIIYYKIRENEHSLGLIIVTGIIATIIGNLLIPSNISVFDITEYVKESSTDIPNDTQEKSSIDIPNDTQEESSIDIPNDTQEESSIDIPNDTQEKENELLATNDNTHTPYYDMMAEIWLNDENIIDCPQIKLPQKLEITDSAYYEMTWEPFEGVSTYKIFIWKDLNYGTSDSNVIPVGEIEVNGLSYIIDFNTLEYRCVYGFNVVVDNHYSAPLLVELHSLSY